MEGRCNVGHKLDNARYGGGKAGSEHRYSMPAVDEAVWDEAKAGAVDSDRRWGGEVGQVIAYANTMGHPRGMIMGATAPNDASNGFSSNAGARS